MGDAYQRTELIMLGAILELVVKLAALGFVGLIAVGVLTREY